MPYSVWYSFTQKNCSDSSRPFEQALIYHSVYDRVLETYIQRADYLGIQPCIGK